MDPSTRHLRLIRYIGETLGEASASSVVADASKHCGIDLASITEQQERILLEKLSQSPGLIGVVAQMVRTRVKLEGLLLKSGKASAASQG